MQLFLKFIFDEDLSLHVSDGSTVPSSGVSTLLYAAIGICYAIYVDCLLARSGWTVDLSETCRVLYQK
jgi:hypothetical protein